MTPEGSVLIDLPREAGAPVGVRFSQPGDVYNVLRERTPEQALTLLPALYSVCATAQSHAATLALEDALGVEVTPATQQARYALTSMETLREHVLRIALDWPGFLDEQPRGADVRTVMGLGPRMAAALFQGRSAFRIDQELDADVSAAHAVVDEAEELLVAELFHEPIEAWLSRTSVDDLLSWANDRKSVAARLMAVVFADGSSNSGATTAVPLMPPDARSISRWLQQDGRDELPDFATATPHVPETTLFSRRLSDPIVSGLGGHGLSARLLARLVELARLPGELRKMVDAKNAASFAGCGSSAVKAPDIHQNCSNGSGWASVEAARGLLIHAVELRDGVIADYRILPPTRWNFDAVGVAQRALTQLNCSDATEKTRQANLIVNAIDPCVAHQVRVH
ncbi:MAG: nickel-dependent hydrogenase large subunit [Filomicrobium sp.]